ncbi:MAG: 4Fe-4S dicluster domain-containing protein [Dethiobacteria bacterium]|jgi:formate dehydrogenase subunit beta|nr:4Fe-4S ferredoxin [Bacillota bacterium]
MKPTVDKLKEIAAETLVGKKAELILGWQKGSFWWQSFPAFIEKQEELDSLTWDPFCVANLSIYLLEELKRKKKVALFVKGCDALAINRLLQDKCIEREQVLLYGLPCKGMADRAKIEAAVGEELSIREVRRDGDEFIVLTDNGEQHLDASNYLLDKCLSCRYPNPIVYDQLLAQEIDTFPVKERFQSVVKLENSTFEERYLYWSGHFNRCLRCFACRNVCPACNCRECIFDQNEPRWLGKANILSENQFCHLIRAYHVAGRCIDCGECQRVCPMDIPLQELNRKLIKDLNELYGDYDAGTDPEEPQPLGTFKLDDPASFSES